MKTLQDAWDWYESAMTNLNRVRRLGTHPWTEFFRCGLLRAAAVQLVSIRALVRGAPCGMRWAISCCGPCDSKRKCRMRGTSPDESNDVVTSELERLRNQNSSLRARF